MAKLYGTIINDTIYPSSTEESFPTHDALYGKGGYRSVSTLEERNAIPSERLTLGCEVRVMNDTDNGGESTVYYVSSMSPSVVWKKLNNGASKEDVESILKDLKGAPNGIAGLDESGKISKELLPDDIGGDYSKQEVFRGTYVDETTFNDELGSPYTPDKQAVYIDNGSGYIYSYSGSKYVRDVMSWNEV